MFARGNTRLLLFALLGFFAFLVLTQWLSAPEPRTGSAVDGSPPDLDTLDTVSLIYADGIAHVARRYEEAGSHETAVLLLKRVLFLRNQILGPDHPRTNEAKRRYGDALRAREATPEGSDQ